MKYSGYYKCKFCGKTWRHKSNFIPFELVDWWYNVLFLFHIITKHFKILRFKHIAKGLQEIFLKIVIAILWIVVTIMQIILYPIKLIIDLLY